MGRNLKENMIGSDDYAETNLKLLVRFLIEVHCLIMISLKKNLARQAGPSHWFTPSSTCEQVGGIVILNEKLKRRYQLENLDENGY